MENNDGVIQRAKLTSVVSLADVSDQIEDCLAFYNVPYKENCETDQIHRDFCQ